MLRRAPRFGFSIIAPAFLLRLLVFLLDTSVVLAFTLRLRVFFCPSLVVVATVVLTRPGIAANFAVVVVASVVGVNLLMALLPLPFLIGVILLRLLLLSNLLPTPTSTGRGNKIIFVFFCTSDNS